MDARYEDTVPRRSIPDVLYKYRPLSGCNRERVRQTIVENKVYFSSRAHFNDPFDCRLHMSFTGTDREWMSYFKNIIKKFEPELSREQRQAKARYLVKEERLHRSPEVRRGMLDEVQRALDKVGIFSLSARNDSILMWSYYAEQHTGLCLGFLHRQGVLGPAFPVEHSSPFPKVNFSRTIDGARWRRIC